MLVNAPFVSFVCFVGIRSFCNPGLTTEHTEKETILLPCHPLLPWFPLSVCLQHTDGLILTAGPESGPAIQKYSVPYFCSASFFDFSSWALDTSGFGFASPASSPITQRIPPRIDSR